MDGGSTDGSVEVIEKYAPWLTYWESTSDRGAAHAINKGLARVSGDWFNWLNSDDYLLPNALKMLVRLSQHVPDAKWISGGRIDVTEEGLPGRLRCPWLHHPNTVGLGKAHFLQDATFVQTAFLREHGITIPEEYSNAFDTVFFYRLLQHEKPLLTTTPFSAMRWHEAQKTADKANRRHEYQTGVLPFLQGRPLIIRALSAMLQSKFHPVVRALILLLTFYGLLPESSDWTACVYDNFEGEIREIEARRLVLLQGR
jgi:glycosyltransferase involved in cell wall biosynthesis